MPLCQLLPLHGQPGPHRVEQPHAKPHFNPFTPDGGFVVVPDKGLDCVFSFRFHDGRLVPADPLHATARESAGPRHIAFHPAAPYAYCINELDSSVVTYRLDPRTGALQPLQVLPSLPEDYTGNNRAAAIQVDGRGRYVYASNRGHDSIAVFRIDAHTGLLRWRGAWPTGGRTPRHIVLAPDGAHLYALNEDSDGISVFRVDPDDGGLAPVGQAAHTGSPVCMVFSE